MDKYDWGGGKIKINSKKVIIAGIVGGIVNTIYSILVCSGIMMPYLEEITGKDFWIPNTVAHIAIMTVFSFLICILWAFGYAILYKGIPGVGLSKGVSYGFLLWLLGILPQTVALHLHTTIWPEFNWVFLSINSLVRWLILGIVYATIYKIE